jgi:hypothetical protein
LTRKYAQEIIQPSIAKFDIGNQLIEKLTKKIDMLAKRTEEQE